MYERRAPRGGARRHLRARDGGSPLDAVLDFLGDVDRVEEPDEPEPEEQVRRLVRFFIGDGIAYDCQEGYDDNGCDDFLRHQDTSSCFSFVGRGRTGWNRSTIFAAHVTISGYVNHSSKDD